MSKKVKGPHEDITYRIIGTCMAVHRRLGPGHKEAVYQRALEASFTEAGLSFEAQKNLEVYDEGRLVGYYIPDFIVEGKVIVELKSVEKVHPAHKKQLLTHLRLAGMKLGYLLNSGEALMKDGITRTIHGQL